jgi:putative methanogenesis marker protein 17
MKVEVEGTEKYGTDSYVELFNGILLDVGLTRMIEAVKFVIRPSDPLFLISIRTRKPVGLVKVSDIADVSGTEGGTMVTIRDETYAPTLISLLWRKYGRERIDQLTRLELFCRRTREEEISDLDLDPGEELKSKVLDAVWRLLPEGFKIRHNISSENVMTIAATEHDMKKEWIELAEKVHAEMGVG